MRDNARPLHVAWVSILEIILAGESNGQSLTDHAARQDGVLRSHVSPALKRSSCLTCQCRFRLTIEFPRYRSRAAWSPAGFLLPMQQDRLFDRSPCSPQEPT